jgi:hypothetical protein
MRVEHERRDAVRTTFTLVERSLESARRAVQNRMLEAGDH